MEQRLDKIWKTINYPIDKEYWVKEIRQGKNYQWEVDLSNYAISDSNIWYTEITKKHLDVIAQYKVPFDKKFHCKLFFVKIMQEDYYSKYPELGETALIWNVTNVGKVSNHKIIGSNNEGSIALKVESTKPLLVDMKHLKTTTIGQRRDLVLTFDAPFDEVLKAWKK